MHFLSDLFSLINFLLSLISFLLSILNFPFFVLINLLSFMKKNYEKINPITCNFECSTCYIM
ncbi:hypothetical protein D3C71_706020 [compost metagenome]